MKVIYTKMGIILFFCLSSPCESESFSRSVVSDSLQPHGLQDPLSMGISQQEYCSGLPFSSPGDLPNPWIEQGLLHCRQILYHLSYQGSPVKPLM